MTDQLSNLIAGVIAQATGTPRETGATAKFRRRLENAGTATVILADCSSSMAESAGSRTKIEVLREALNSVWLELDEPRLIGFCSTVEDCFRPGDLPQPAGGTALHLALSFAIGCAPARTLVISDGRPDDADRALLAADHLPGIIDVIYCGPDSDADAIAFMQRLARAGGGRVVRHDLRRAPAALAGEVRTMLALPPAGGR